MSDEIHDWLTDLHRSDPPTAMSVAQALTALMSEGASLGPPLVIPAADSSPPEDLPVGDEAATRLRDVTGQIERELRRKPWPEGLSELRPEVPDGGEIRVIFAVEPPGTALLIAVLEGREAVRDQYTEAITLSADVLRQARAGQAPEAAAHGYDDPVSFLEEFHPGQAAEVQAAAAALIARNRTRTLSEQRTRLGFTQAEVAHRMGVRQERVSAIERAEPDAIEVRTLASYIEALGGRLELIADFSGERVPLR
jgi:DNA-binding XRE family transcriptional regulator